MARISSAAKGALQSVSADADPAVPPAVERLRVALDGLDQAKRRHAQASAEREAAVQAAQAAERRADAADPGDDGIAADAAAREARRHAKAAAEAIADAEREVLRHERQVVRLIEPANLAYREAALRRLVKLAESYGEAVQPVAALLAEVSALRGTLGMMGLSTIRLPVDLRDPMSRTYDLGAPGVTPTTPELWAAREARHLIDRARRVEDQVDRRQPSAA